MTALPMTHSPFHTCRMPIAIHDRRGPSCGRGHFSTPGFAERSPHVRNPMTAARRFPPFILLTFLSIVTLTQLADQSSATSRVGPRQDFIPCDDVDTPSPAQPRLRTLNACPFHKHQLSVRSLLPPFAGVLQRRINFYQ